MNDIRSELLHAMREIIRESIMTLHAIPDPDARHRGWSQLPQMFIRDAAEAYGYSSPSVRKWIPSPRHCEQMPIAMNWLAWLRRTEGQLALRRIWAWALGVNLWRIAQQEGGCSDATIFNRIDRSVVRIIRHFASVDIAIEHIEEPYQGAVFAIIFEPVTGPVSGIVELRKIYVGGKGMWKQGEGYIRDGDAKIRRLKKNA